MNEGTKDEGQTRDSTWSAGWMRVFLETAVDAIIVIDARGSVESFNPAAERMFGYRASEVLGRNVNLLMPAPFHAEHDGYLHNFLTTGRKKIIGIGREVEALREDGEVFPVHLSVAELEYEGRKYFTGVLRDLTAERAARAREIDTARIVESSVNEVYLFDADTLRFIQVNASGRSNLGYSMSELAMLTPVDIEPEFTLAGFQERLNPLRTGARDRLIFRTTHARKDGTTYPAEVQLQLSSFAGRPAFVAIILDTTERDELQRRLLHSQKLEAIGQLSGALAHDFNNLLMGVISGCRMVADRIPDDSEAAAMLHEIRDEARRGTGITRQLLDFSRKRTYATRPCDLAAIVDGAESLFRKLLGEGVELRVSTSGHGSAVQADPAKIDQILMNLVVNARDAMPTGGRLSIRVERVDLAHPTPELAAGPYVVVTVADDGCGMDAATQARVFEPFFTTKAMGQGTGLGLSTVFGLTQEFGGSVELESAPGRGATFRLYFPVLAGDHVSAAEEPVASSGGGEETILLVEDAALVRAGLRSLLGELGYVVHDAASPKQALAMIAELPPIDLLLTDMVMPGMNGAELAKEIQTRYPSVRVLFMSAYSDEALIEQGRLRAGVPVLEKPFEEEELARRVREVLDA